MPPVPVPQFLGAELPPLAPPSELNRSQVQDRPPKQSGALGDGVRHAKMSSGEPVPPPVPPQHSTKPGMGEQAGSVGLVAQLQVGASIAHIGLGVPPPPLVPDAPQEQTPSPGLVPVPPGRGMPGRPPTLDGWTQLEPLAALQKAMMLSHFPVVS